MIKAESKELRSLITAVKRYDKKLMTAVKLTANQSAKSLENQAKRRAKWTDRTGQARASIAGNYEARGFQATIELSGYAQKPANRGTVGGGKKRRKGNKKNTNGDYFQYLEYAHRKKWAVLHPTVEKQIPKITKRLIRNMSKVKIK